MPPSVRIKGKFRRRDALNLPTLRKADAEQGQTTLVTVSDGSTAADNDVLDGPLSSEPQKPQCEEKEADVPRLEVSFASTFQRVAYGVTRRFIRAIL